MTNKTKSRLRCLVFLTTTLTALPVALAQSNGAPDSNTVLIYGPGTSKTVWEQAAAAAGFTVEVATEASWDLKTTVDFATYRTIVVPDNWCSGPAAAVVDSRSVWGPAIDGNVLVVGGDPDYHTASSWPASGSQAQVGAAQLIYNGIAFTGDWAGHTGAYLPLGCSATVTVLEPFGSFTALYSSSDSVHLVASHPALDGLTDANQSNWGSSTHSGFTDYPADFIPLAIQDGSAASPCFADGHCGYPYLLARGNGLQPAGLNIQTSGPAEADSGSTITYTITYGNTGGTAATGVTISDPVPAGATYVGGSASGGGTLSGGNVVWSIGTVDAGSTDNTRTFQVTIVQSSGSITNADYSISGDGLDPVAGADVVTNVLAPPTSIITASAGANGSITPSGAVSVDYDASQSFTILPDAGYHILDVLVDGATAGAVGSYTFDNVIAPHTIAASFAIDQYVINGSSDATGAVTCPSPIDHGSPVTCSIEPAAGYVLDALTDNGADVLAQVIGDTYTIDSVTAAHDIAGVFKQTLGTDCSGASDCHSGFCADGVCCDSACGGASDDCSACSVAAGAAADGVCGPSTGNSCSDGSLCTHSDTCDAGTCAGEAVVCTALDECHVAGVCQEADGSCTNPDEVDGTACNNGIGECTGGACMPSDGQPCDDDAGCASGHCADGLCCNATCAGQCEACDLEGQEGSCVPVTGAPRNDRIACAGSGSVCDGACDGVDRMSCTYPGAETTCREAGCEDGTATLAATCDSAGSCPPPQTADCAPDACGDTACQGDCAVDLDCAEGSWCSGGVCTQKKDLGAGCATGNECAGGACADGVCCDAACDGQCEACNEPGTAGSCVPVTGAPRNGRAPCVADGSACDGYCDGSLTSACTYPDLTVACRAATCEDGIATLAAFCNGTGVCPLGQVQSCGANDCGPTQCLGDCTVDGDCAASQWCAGGICKPREENGATCGAANECASGNCVDGVCCDGACRGQCEACDNAEFEGQCLPATGAPHGARPSCASDGSVCGGACDGADRAACSYPDQGTSCRAAGCTAGVATLAASCDGAGACPNLALQSCGAYGCNAVICNGDCTVDSHCAPDHWCSAGVCVPAKIQGSTCGAANECATGHCVDGVCCNGSCDGQCQACAEPGSEGSCVAVVGAPRASRTQCATDGTACGGACDGADALACSYPDNAVVCVPAACDAGVATPVSYCDGAGGCAAADSQSCAPYACSGDACGADCSAEADCGGSNVCFEGSCVTTEEALAAKDRRLDQHYEVVGSGPSCAGGGAQPLAALILGLLIVGLALRRRRASLILSVALLLASGGTAHAAEVSTDILLQRFQPASGFADILSVQAAPERGEFRLGFSASINYGKDPLRLVADDGNRDRTVVGRQAGLDLGATVGLFDRWELSLVIPVTVDQKNGGASLVDPRFDSPGTSAGVSDIRVSPKVRLYNIGSLVFAAAAPVALPTGDASSYRSGGATVTPKAIAEWDGPVRVVANLGVVLRRSRDLVALELGPALSYGAGAEMPFAIKDQEVAGLLTVVGETGLRAANIGTSPLEMLGAVRWRHATGLAVTLGGGPGLTTGYGTPRYRLLASLGFAPFGIGQPEPTATDALADVPNVITPQPAPAPEEPEPVIEPEPVAESEPIVELEPEPEAEPEPAAEPLPEETKVVVEETRIVTLEKVFFDTGMDTVIDRSRDVLAQVASILLANPEIRLVRIEGHTDNLGPAELNMDLSARRARAVREILIQHGVEPDRLEAVGLGPTRPIDSNETDRGRANNRRVEFIVVERDAAPSGESAADQE